MSPRYDGVRLLYNINPLVVYSLYQSFPKRKEVHQAEMESWKMTAPDDDSKLKKFAEVLRLKRGWSLFQEFCNDTSIHGVKFLGAKKKHWTEKLWLIISKLMTLCTSCKITFQIVLDTRIYLLVNRLHLCDSQNVLQVASDTSHCKLFRALHENLGNSLSRSHHLSGQLVLSHWSSIFLESGRQCKVQLGSLYHQTAASH